jgi:ubiquinol oxidase
MPAVLGLYLSNAEVAAAETRREAAGSGIAAHPFARMLYDVGCLFLDHFFDGRPIARFWFLETVARVPYFSYTSLLHLYESLGWWRATGLRQVHHAGEPARPRPRSAGSASVPALRNDMAAPVPLT